MGWTFTYKPKGMSVRRFFEERFNYQEADGRYGRVIDCAVVNLRTAYLAYEIGKPDGSREVIAVVCLLSFAPNSEYNFGYKDIEETMGPYRCDCPERILRLLTPTDSEWANEWRRKCWERVEAKKKRPKLRKGTVIRLPEPITFRSGRRESVFRAENPRRGLFTDRYGSRYRIPRSYLNRFEVLDDFPPVEIPFDPDFRPEGEARYDIRSVTAEDIEKLIEELYWGDEREEQLKSFRRDPDRWLKARGMLPLGHHVAVIHPKGVTYLATFATEEEAAAFVEKRLAEAKDMAS